MPFECGAIVVKPHLRPTKIDISASLDEVSTTTGGKPSGLSILSTHISLEVFDNIQMESSIQFPLPLPEFHLPSNLPTAPDASENREAAVAESVDLNVAVGSSAVVSFFGGPSPLKGHMRSVKMEIIAQNGTYDFMEKNVEFALIRGLGVILYV